MAVLQMQRVSICALKKDRKSILEKLQSMGILEISQVADEDDAFSRMDTMNARVSFEKKANIADQALDVLDGYAPESKSMFASLEGKKLIGSSRFQSAVADKEKIKFDEKQYNQSLPLIKTQLKALIARDLWDMNEYFQVMNSTNQSVQQALKVLNEDIYSTIIQ